MIILIGIGLIVLGVAAAELVRWLRGRRYPFQMTLEVMPDIEADVIRHLAARSRRTQEQMRRVVHLHEWGGRA